MLSDRQARGEVAVIVSAASPQIDHLQGTARAAEPSGGEPGKPLFQNLRPGRGVEPRPQTQPIG